MKKLLFAIITVVLAVESYSQNTNAWFLNKQEDGEKIIEEHPFLRLWLDAWNKTYITGNYSTLKWLDRSGNNIHFERKSGDGTPRYTNNRVHFDQYDALRFDGSPPLGMTSNDFTLFIVYDPINNNGGYLFLEEAIYSSFAFIVNPNGRTNVYNQSISGTNFISHGNKRLLTITKSGRNFRWFLNGNNSPSKTHYLNWYDNYYRSGKRSYLGLYYEGYVSEVIMFNGYVSETHRVKIRDYLLNKWGL